MRCAQQEVPTSLVSDTTRVIRCLRLLVLSAEASEPMLLRVLRVESSRQLVLGVRGAEDMSVELGRQPMDLTGELGVQPQLLFLGREVMIRLGALELGLAVLPDHDERS